MKSKKQKKSLFRDRLMLRRLLVTFAAAVLLGALYSLIFSFSAQEGGESGSLSRMISEKCVGFLNWLSGSRWNEAKEAEVAGWFEYPLRKLAHFSEYACMGVLVYTLWSQWISRGKRLYIRMGISVRRGGRISPVLCAGTVRELCGCAARHRRRCLWHAFLHGFMGTLPETQYKEEKYALDLP